MYKTFLASALLTVSMSVNAALPVTDATPLLPVGSATDITIYECFPNHYLPPCRKITKDGVDVDYLELRAASAAAIMLVPIKIGDDLTLPVEACSNSHGGSGCCRVLKVPGGAPGAIYIECGVR